MWRPLVTVFLWFILDSCSTTIKVFPTTDQDKLGVKSNKFRGTVFKKSYPQDKLFISSIDSINRFTPTENEIKQAEAILKKQIEQENKDRLNQLKKKEYIHRNLNKYFRQYIGFTNHKGEKVIHINFDWDRYTLFDRIIGNWDDRNEYTSDFTVTFDGGSRHWSINVNLTTGKLEGLSINGVA
ncbi:hypothetical protein ESA94_09765 [Lacibacter luteus]|uniref:Uncharacterized protein n=1 Tax=Lacibacter luteus TaxID=2508719 RepID=A0A4Q1CJB2_9BACT|nr:hypothetical protein [Lacibacter luteus]RXK60740.1 hypothetical protein ESA94_09765 [Lacibacter luteus]